MRNFLVIILLSSLFNSCDLQKKESLQVDELWWVEADRYHIIAELDRTTKALQGAVDTLSEHQVHFHEDSSRWSIIEIIEHLEIQNQLHFRELSVTSKAPQHLEFRSITKGQDDYFTQYSTDPRKGQAQWFLQPRGRYNSLSEAWMAFYKARSELRRFVAETDIDLRKQFTYRTVVERKKIETLKIGEVRDLHQLLLTGIAHTDRHLSQIRKIKDHDLFPEE